VTTTSPAGERRRYDNTLRRERAAQTRRRIVSAGAELLSASSIRDWRTVTMRAVAERAGVNQRTVYRHFPNERALRDAVLHHIEQEAGIDLSRMRLEDVADVAARVFRSLSRYAPPTRSALDPTLEEAKQRQQDALLAAVSAHTQGWPPEDRTLVAAAFDILWAPASYERLLLNWGLDPEEAIGAATWVIGLVEDAIREGRRPANAKGHRSPR
jgi:AcrR family transcriptional regulator